MFVFKQSFGRVFLAGMLLIFVGLTGCESQREEPVSRSRTSDQPTQQAQAQEQPATDARIASASMAFPSGARASSVLLVEKRLPRHIRAGQPFEYTLKVTNLTDQPLSSVVVYDQAVPPSMAMLPPEAIQDQLRARGAEPWDVYAIPREGAAPAAAAGAKEWEVFAIPLPSEAAMEPGSKEEVEVGRWMVGHLGPGESKSLRVTGQADRAGQLRSCTTASYQPSVCMTSQVIKPELKLERIVPETSSACEMVPIRYRVTNTGVGPVEGIRVREDLPQGWTFGDEQRTAAFDIASLQEGQSREFTVNAKVLQRGQFGGIAYAEDSFGQRYESDESFTRITAPELTVTVTGPREAIAGQSMTYQIEVANKGDETARDLVVRQRVPSDAEILQASGTASRQANDVVWRLQPLQPGQSTKVNLSLRSSQIAAFQSTVTASAACARAVSGQTMTDIQGLAALLLEVVDSRDPVQLGGQEVYTITVTNQGSATEEQITISVELPDAMRYQSASGDAQPQVDGNRLTYTISRLAPKQTATLNITTTAQEAGEAQIQVQMTAEGFEKPVRETETTRLY